MPNGGPHGDHFEEAKYALGHKEGYEEGYRQTIKDAAAALRRMPPTRYQGSKRRLLAWLASHLSQLDFTSVLDAFGGTGCLSYYFKWKGWSVTYNDYLSSNAQMAVGLLENQATVLREEDLDFILTRHTDQVYDDLIERVYHDIYFYDAENRWLDTVAQNITLLSDRFKRGLATYALCQAAISKRPYNLFHRRNLYMRSAEVPRSFGNKATWDKPFDVHLREFATQANAAVFQSSAPARVLCEDVSHLSPGHDLVYIDPPYVSSKGVGVDYHAFYHFLEGLCNYRSWASAIDWRRKHRPFTGSVSPWSNPRTVKESFGTFLDAHRNSLLAISYRRDGIPSIEQLTEMLEGIGKSVTRYEYGRLPYALSPNRNSQEVLLVGE